MEITPCQVNQSLVVLPSRLKIVEVGCKRSISLNDKQLLHPVELFCIVINKNRAKITDIILKFIKIDAK